MSLILAGRFDTFADAERAARMFFANGFREEDLSIFYVNPPGQHHRYPVGGDENQDAGTVGARRTGLIGVGIGAGVGGLIGVIIVMAAGLTGLLAVLAGVMGAYFGSLIGALSGTRDTRQKPQATGTTGFRQAGVLLSVRVTRDNEAEAVALLQRCGGKEIEEAQGRWRDGRWVDFDPVKPPHLSDKTPEGRRQPAQAATGVGRNMEGR